jgi:hypothetical protein
MLDSSTCRLTSASQAEQELCTARSFHGFYRYLQHHGLYPRPETAKSVRESVHHIRQILMSPDVAQYLRGCVITFTGSSIPASAQQLLLDRHSKTCRIEEELSRRLRAVFKTVPHAAEAELVRQMRRNAGKPLLSHRSNCFTSSANSGCRTHGPRMEKTERGHSTPSSS